MVRLLQPELDATERDIEVVSLSSILMVRPYNDLGLLVKDALILCSEAQSAWSLNVLGRYLEEREKEVKDIMMASFTQADATERYGYEREEKGREKGEGKLGRLMAVLLQNGRLYRAVFQALFFNP